MYAVGVGGEGENFGVVDEAVDHGGCDVVSERFVPSPERQVRGDHDGALFVAGCDELEEPVGGVGVEGDVADPVDDDELVAADFLQLRLESAAVVRGREAGDSVVGGVEEDIVPLGDVWLTHPQALGCR